MTTAETIKKSEIFGEQRLIARRILRASGERRYHWWLANVYEYPLERGMPSHDFQFERSPLTRDEEQRLIDERDRRLGRAKQSRLSKFVTKPGSKCTRPKRKMSKEPTLKTKQADIVAFLRRKKGVN